MKFLCNFLLLLSFVSIASNKQLQYKQAVMQSIASENIEDLKYLLKQDTNLINDTDVIMYALKLKNIKTINILFPPDFISTKQREFTLEAIKRTLKTNSEKVEELETLKIFINFQIGREHESLEILKKKVSSEKNSFKRRSWYNIFLERLNLINLIKDCNQILETENQLLKIQDVRSKKDALEQTVKLLNELYQIITQDSDEKLNDYCEKMHTRIEQYNKLIEKLVIKSFEVICEQRSAKKRAL